MIRRFLLSLSFALLAVTHCASGQSGTPNYQGLWWNPTESGWGINFAHQGDIIFATWYTYDTTGNPWWLAATLRKDNAGAFSGDVYEVSGQAFDSVPWLQSRMSTEVIGTMQVVFASGSDATLTYAVDGVARTKAITKQLWGTAPTCVWGAQSDLTQATNFTDIWWNASESGWGIYFNQQSNVIYATWFTYDAGGNPWWLAATMKPDASTGVYTGDLGTLVGSPFALAPWDASRVKRTTVGVAAARFTDGNHANFSYTLNGSTQTKALTRQVFSPPGTVCSDDAGATNGSLAITTQPQSVKAALGSAASVSVTAVGSGALSYQWYKGGVAIAGATASTYAIASLTAAHAGRYHVVVTDATGALASAKAAISPTSEGEPVDVYDQNDGFNPADDVANVNFAYAVVLNGTTVTASGFASTAVVGGVATLTDALGKTVVVDTSASPITVTSSVTGGYVNVVLSGSLATGLEIASAKQLGITLDAVTITSAAGPAINVNSAVRAFVMLSGASVLTEASPAATASNAAIYSKGSLLFGGTGSATVTGGADYPTHAVKAKDHIRVAGGALTLKTRYNPPAKLGGVAALIAGTDTSKVYGVSASGAFIMDGGMFAIASADELASGNVPGWGRGIGVSGVDDASSPNANVIGADGTVSQVRTGFLVVNGGTLTINTFDKAMTAKYKCRGATYTTTAGSYADYDGDGACATPATGTAAADPNPFITINGGAITIRTTGTPCDPTETMGMSATCTSTSPSVSPEGIEAKSVITINGGTVEIEATDDALNAGISIGNNNYATNYGNAIVINGGRVYASSSKNDGIDSNAVANPGVTVNGGVVIANGAGAPEEGFDVDPYTVAFNGGTSIGIGGGNSSVYGASTQRYASVTSLTQGRTLAVWKTGASGSDLIFAYNVPAATAGATGASRLSGLLSDARLVVGSTYGYALVDGSSVSCSAWFHGLCVGTMSASLPTGGTTSLTVR